MQLYQHPPSGPHFSSRESVASSGSQGRTSIFQLGYSNTNPYVEKDKMLRGQPFLHYLDSVLRQDRQSCQAALERFNRTADASLFMPVLKPHQRPDTKSREYPHTVPAEGGSIGDHCIVESPFKCEYGYNIHMGQDCVVESGCYFQDAADIYIGHKVIIGHNVKLYCITVSLEPALRKGSQGNVVAGAIKIDNDCFIGADVVIMPYVTIGKGAVVGAGSVVTRVSFRL